jgi:hypothetical protein
VFDGDNHNENEKPINIRDMRSNEVIVKMVLDRWYALIKQFDAALASLTDAQLQKEIAPGKNRGVYLLGHLTAVHDDMLALMDFGSKLFPELSEPFIKSPDRSTAAIPSAEELRSSWNKINETLAQKFNSLQADEWFQKHTSVSEEDFAKEPHRNKLNIVVTRTSHLAYHLGQFVLLK